MLFAAALAEMARNDRRCHLMLIEQKLGDRVAAAGWVVPNESIDRPVAHFFIFGTDQAAEVLFVPDQMRHSGHSTALPDLPQEGLKTDLKTGQDRPRRTRKRNSAAKIGRGDAAIDEPEVDVVEEIKDLHIKATV